MRPLRQKGLPSPTRRSVHRPADLAALAAAFHEAHRRRYGHMAENEAVEIVNFKVTAVGAIPKPRLRPALVRGGGPPKPGKLFQRCR